MDGQSSVCRSEIADCGAVNEQFDGLQNLPPLSLSLPPALRMRCCVIVRPRKDGRRDDVVTSAKKRGRQPRPFLLDGVVLF